jgi:hypothetical protein
VFGGLGDRFNYVERALKLPTKESFVFGLVAESKKDEFLNKIAKAIGDIGEGYWFSGESVKDGKLVFEFTASNAPTIILAISEEELEKYTSDE